MAKKTVYFSGGLGNQMFQYVFLLALREKWRDVQGDISLFCRNNAHVGFEMSKVFGIEEIFLKSKIRAYSLAVLSRIHASSLVFEEGNRLLDIDDLGISKRHFCGYWQNIAYFRGLEDKIRAAFIFKNISCSNEMLAQKMRKEESVSIHLRRGDYVGHSLYSGICTEDYYRSALSLFGGMNFSFYVFSDDIDYAFAFFKKLNIPVKIIDWNKGMDSFQDMYLMSACKHHILANSSFSWWGAWLGVLGNDNKTVAPKRWQNRDKSYYEGVYLKHWILI